MSEPTELQAKIQSLEEFLPRQERKILRKGEKAPMLRRYINLATEMSQMHRYKTVQLLDRDIRAFVSAKRRLVVKKEELRKAELSLRRKRMWEELPEEEKARRLEKLAKARENR